MARIGFTAVGCVLSLLAIAGASVADPACNGIAVVDVVESNDGSLVRVGDRCLERGPGLPFYYDAPNPGTRGTIELDEPSSVT